MCVCVILHRNHMETGNSRGVWRVRSSAVHDNDNQLTVFID